MKLQCYAVFHLNIAYSSIEEAQRADVVRKCYWPLLRLARKYDLPFGIEAPAYTLAAVLELDRAWVCELRRLITDGPCEFVGSGYAQVIGPLVPPEINAANLRLGNIAYEQLLGCRPQTALINEQAYSAGLIRHYLDAGYKAIIMEWDNPARCHPEWSPEWRYLPQKATGTEGDEIPLIWAKSIAFQKFQRFAHGEIELDEYLSYLRGHVAEKPRAFPLYGNDVEIFDFRPGRYKTEPACQDESEWLRIDRLFATLRDDDGFVFIRPSAALGLIGEVGAGNRLSLESPEQPIPVKKQEKYNITRWAITGRDDLGINTACWRAYDGLRSKPRATDDDWRELCYLWSSDFRTHITAQRWADYRSRLAAFERRHSLPQPTVDSDGEALGLEIPEGYTITRQGRFLTVTAADTKVKLNCRRGLSIDSLFFGSDDHSLCGTLHHGYFDDIALGADFYSGHLVLEGPGQPKVTDLEPVAPEVRYGNGAVIVRGVVETALGPVYKSVRIFGNQPRIELEYELSWSSVPVGSLRLGYVTLNPAAFEYATLYYRTHNGGDAPETFRLAQRTVDHGGAVSFLVSASQALGVTSGMVDIGDARHGLRVTVDKTAAALIAFMTCRQVAGSCFCRLAFSMGEVDETRRQSEQYGAVPRVRIALAPLAEA